MLFVLSAGGAEMLSLDLGLEPSTPGSTLELGAAGMLQVYLFITLELIQLICHEKLAFCKRKLIC